MNNIGRGPPGVKTFTLRQGSSVTPYRYQVKGGPLTTKWLLWVTSNLHILESLSILGLVFGHVSSTTDCLHFP